MPTDSVQMDGNTTLGFQRTRVAAQGHDLAGDTHGLADELLQVLGVDARSRFGCHVQIWWRGMSCTWKE